MHLTPFQINHNNLYQLYRSVLVEQDRYGKCGFIEFPIDQTNAWPSFIFSDKWGCEVVQIREAIQSAKNQILGNQVFPCLIIPTNDQTETLNLILREEGFIGVKLWYSMNLEQQASNPETPGKMKIVDTDEELSLFAAIVNACHFEKQPLAEEIFEILKNIDGIKLCLSINNNEATSACICHQTNESTGIYMVSTLSEYRNKGYSGGMLQQIAQIEKKPLILQATVKSAPLYKRIGFIPNGSYTIYWLKPSQ